MPQQPQLLTPPPQKDEKMEALLREIRKRRGMPEPKGAPEAPGNFDWLKDAGALASRVGGGVLGGIAGTAAMPLLGPAGPVLGASFGSGLGEAGAEWLQGQPLNPSAIGVQTLLGPAMSKIPGVGKFLSNPFARGAATGAVGSALTDVGNNEAPDLGRMGENALGGALLGPALGKLAQRIGGGRPAPSRLPLPMAEAAPEPNTGPSIPVPRPTVGEPSFPTIALQLPPPSPVEQLHMQKLRSGDWPHGAVPRPQGTVPHPQGLGLDISEEYAQLNPAPPKLPAVVPAAWPASEGTVMNAPPFLGEPRGMLPPPKTGISPLPSPMGASAPDVWKGLKGPLTPADLRDFVKLFGLQK